MATLNKQYTLNMQMADGTTKSASFVIPVNQPTAAEVPCDEVWSKTFPKTTIGKTWTSVIGGDGKEHYTSWQTFNFKAKIMNPSVVYDGIHKGWSLELMSNGTEIKLIYDGLTAPTQVGATVAADLVPTVDNYLTYLYNNKK